MGSGFSRRTIAESSQLKLYNNLFKITLSQKAGHQVETLFVNDVMKNSYYTTFKAGMHNYY